MLSRTFGTAVDLIMASIMTLGISYIRIRLTAVAAVVITLIWHTAASYSGNHFVEKQQTVLHLKTCYEEVLTIQQTVPSLTDEIKPLLLSSAIISTHNNTVWHLRCNEVSRHRQSLGWPIPHRGQQIKLLPTAASGLQRLQGLCNETVPGLSIILGRIGPLKHFGHRMLGDLPALYALKLFLQEREVDISKINVYFLDDMGLPAWGTKNFKPILESLGYASYNVQASASSTMCFHQVILMPVTFYPKWITVSGKPVNMWSAPERLYDADPFHIKMVGDIRAAFGLPNRLPFVNASKVQIVLASRDKHIRKRAGFRMTRILSNEDDLHKALAALPEVTAKQVDLGMISMDNIVQLLDNTSLLVGYHGAAFDNLIFLPRGAYILEILPKGTTHSPLYPSLAMRTGKEFTRYVNANASLQSCRRKKDGQDVMINDCLGHDADLQVNVTEVVQLVKSILYTQQAAMSRYKFDDTV